MRTYRFTADCDGITLQDFLRRMHGFSASQIRRLKQTPDCVRVNGKFMRMVDLLKCGDRICLQIREDGSTASANYALHADIVYEDADLLVYNKPANMAVHRSIRHREDTLENVFAAYCEQHALSAPFRPINRLDRDTTGLCAIAKTAHAAHLLGGAMQKEYIAICAGKVAAHGLIDAPIERAGESIILRKIGANGQRAVTEYHRVKSADGCSLVRFLLHTGRTHQIRVHMAYIGHPLLGDALYGGDCTRIRRQALHCGTLRFFAPDGGREVVLTVPLPDDMSLL